MAAAIEKSPRCRHIHIVTVGLPHGGYHIVGVATSYKKAEEFVHSIEDETGCLFASDDIDIETWQVNTMDSGDSETEVV